MFWATISSIIHPLSPIQISQALLLVPKIYFDLIGESLGPRQQAKLPWIIINIPYWKGTIWQNIVFFCITIAGRRVVSSALTQPSPSHPTPSNQPSSLYQCPAASTRLEWSLFKMRRLHFSLVVFRAKLGNPADRGQFCMLHKFHPQKNIGLHEY